MSILVELPERLYQPDAFADFKPIAAFDPGTARAMAWMAQLAYETEQPDKIARVCALWLLGRPRVIASAATGGLPLMHTRAIVVEGRDATILAFAGTDPLVPANWFTDFDVRVTPRSLHRGFEKAVDVVWPQIVAALASRRAQPVFLTGHSLGGALAAVAADRALSDDAVRLRATAVYGFGMPRAGDQDFALRYNDTLGAATYRLVHGDDVVATVPPSSLGFRHVGRLLRCDRGGRFGAMPAEDFTDDPPFRQSLVAGLKQSLRDFFAFALQPTFRDDPLGRLSGFLPPPVADHLPDRYWHAFGATE